MIPSGWVSNDAFLAGYGATQAVIALVAIFVPSFLLVVGALPFWDEIRQIKAMQTALLGISPLGLAFLEWSCTLPVDRAHLISLYEVEFRY